MERNQRGKHKNEKNDHLIEPLQRANSTGAIVSTTTNKPSNYVSSIIELTKMLSE
jgi:hypothetical protein